jgi:pyruvate dehydrogenase E1 component alpha subunit
MSDIKTKSDNFNRLGNPEFGKDPNINLSTDDKIKIYRDMVRIRKFEERSLQVYQQGKIAGFLHLYIGQESIAVGTISLQGPNDHIITAYRDHGHGLAVGMNMNECMAELQGKYTGCSKGKGGSMHYFAPDKNYWGGHGIVAGQTPLGAGLAFALKYKGDKGCCMCYLGDGAVNQGAFMETLNLVSLWEIPVIYVIENNTYSMGTSQERSSAYRECLAKRAEAFDMDWSQAQGNDIYDVRAKMWEAMDRAYNQSKPTIIEMSTYRYRGHSVADADNGKIYRSKEEIEEYQKTKDPILLFESKLLADGTLNDKKIKEINKAAKIEADESAKYADESPFPPVESINQNVYWELDNPDQRTSQGTLIFE